MVRPATFRIQQELSLASGPLHFPRGGLNRSRRQFLLTVRRCNDAFILVRILVNSSSVFEDAALEDEKF